MLALLADVASDVIAISDFPGSPEKIRSANPVEWLIPSK
jgi:hypothetical protein